MPSNLSWSHSITPYEYSICEAFATATSRPGKYADTQQGDLSNTVKTALLGKLGEWAAYWFLYSLYRGKVSPVNMADMEGVGRSFDHDFMMLTPEGIAGIHVKTCPLNRLKDSSILVQKNSACSRTDRTFYSPSRSDALLYVQQVHPTVFRVEVLRSTQAILNADIFRKPFVPHLIGMKDALHLEDLLKLPGRYTNPEYRR